MLVSSALCNTSGRHLPGDDGLDRVFDASGLDDEPEQHVSHVDQPDSLQDRGNVMIKLGWCPEKRTNSIKIEPIPKHQLPRAERFRLHGIDRPHQSKTELHSHIRP